MTRRSGTSASPGSTSVFAATHAFRSRAQITDRQSASCSGGSNLPPPQLQLGVESSRAGIWPHAQVSPLEYQCIRSPQVFGVHGGHISTHVRFRQVPNRRMSRWPNAGDAGLPGAFLQDPSEETTTLFIGRGLSDPRMKNPPHPPQAPQWHAISTQDTASIRLLVEELSGVGLRLLT